jgi:hypothetical protein
MSEEYFTLDEFRQKYFPQENTDKRATSTPSLQVVVDEISAEFKKKVAEIVSGS